MNSRFVLSGFCTLLLTLNVSSVSATTWYVDGLVATSDNGTTWQTALQTIQAGIEAASDGDTVIVAEGTYVENICFSGKNIVLCSTNPLDPEVVAKTIIDGNQAGSVVTFNGTEDETCVLSGFTIRNGQAKFGSGICGGTETSRTQAMIQNNAIRGNSAVNWPGEGGGLAVCNGVIQKNIITENAARWSGGGLFECGGIIRNNVITENSGHDGAGLYSCHGLIQNNAIMGNVGRWFGGGLDDCDGTIENNIIAVNWSHDGGGLHGCHGTIRNNTIVGNQAVLIYGGGLCSCHGTIQNCIIWGNKALSGDQLSGSSTPTYSCIQDWNGGGEGNIVEEPQFVDNRRPETYKDNNYRLLPDSPCIDAGSNEGLAPPGLDLDGNLRIAQGRESLTVDMGAYEFNSRPFKVTKVFLSPDGHFSLAWNSQPSDIYVVWMSFALANSEWFEGDTIASQGAETFWEGLISPRKIKFYRVEMK